jgi:aspartyl-tRNA(Asn)/glutamyl-tRNA(Gln) amidotransferase subunit A
VEPWLNSPETRRTKVHPSITEISRQLRARELSPVELTKDCLAAIEKLNPALNAFVMVTAESALREAHQAEIEIQQGKHRGPLHGIPIGLKDLIDTAGVRTTAASALFADRVPRSDAQVVERLKRAGVVFLGKHNLHECAYGGSSLISYFGPARNPWDTASIAGGSSGGSAAAVAAGLCFAAVGSDTAGSIREPAALCGVVGLKPTYGRVSTRGVIPLSFSLDHVGPLTRSVADAALMLEAIAGYDPDDSACADRGVDDYAMAFPDRAKPVRIGVPRSYFYQDLDPEIRSALEHALDVLETLASEVCEVELQVPTDRTLQSAESYAYHAQFVARSPELYHPDTLRRIRKGETISQAEVETCRHELEKVRRDIPQVFEQIDVLVTPTTAVAAPTIADLEADPDELRARELVLLRNTRPFNVWGLPAISVPCGFTKAGLPVGMQIAGPHWQERRVLELAFAYEQATDWHNYEPELPPSTWTDNGHHGGDASGVSNTSGGAKPRGPDENPPPAPAGDTVPLNPATPTIR